MELHCRPGRLRRRRHHLVMVPVTVAAWLWLDLTGAVPVLLWWWHTCPGPLAVPQRLRVDVSRVTAARLGPWRTWVAQQGAPRVEIFSDEVDARDLAGLRRAVKSQLAGP